MNGIKYIREKSNLSQNALAERMGVKRQTITLWEKGIRKPDCNHLKQLSEFYGIEGEWFCELSEEQLELLKEKCMYRHFDGDKEFYTFVPEVDGWNEIRIPCGNLEAMLDDRYADILKKKKDFMKRVEQYLQYETKSMNSAYLCDKIITAERGMQDINTFLNLMTFVQSVGEEGTFLKVPFRFEIKTVLYAAMLASGKCSLEEIQGAYGNDFSLERLHVDVDYLNELTSVMSRHWIESKEFWMQKSPAKRKKHKE